MSIVDKIWNSRYFNLYLFLLFFLIPFLIWLPTILSGYYFVSGDGLSSFITPTYFFINSVFSGEYPLWNSYLAAGQPAVGTGSFYPITILFSFLPSEWLLLLYYSSHLAIGAFFTYLYLREIGCNKISAISIAIIYELSCHLGQVRKNHMLLITATVYLPIVLYFIHRYIRLRKPYILALISLTLAMQFYAGFIQYCVYTIIALSFYSIVVFYKNSFKILEVVKATAVTFFLYLGLILIQLLPQLNIVKEYKKIGSTSSPFEYFTSYSIHFKKLLMMLSPKAFDNVYQSGMGSSELDIEIFLGTSILFLIVYGVIRYRRDYKIVLSFCIMVFSFIYAANAHIPFLSRILYKIPYISDFRVPSRILFIFIFFGFVIAGLTLSKLSEGIERDKLLSLLRRAIKPLLLFFSITFFIYFLIYLDLFNIHDLKKFNKLKEVSISTFTVLLIISLSLLISKYLDKKKRYGYLMFCLIILTATLFEVTKYSLLSSNSKVSDYDLSSENIRKVKNDLGYSKVWVGSPRQEYFQVFFGLNNSQVLSIASLNSYTTFNNPRLYKVMNNNMNPQMNFSGLYTFSLNAYNLLLSHNDLLSILDIKYIWDPLYYLDNRSYIMTPIFDNTNKNILNKKAVDLVNYGSYQLAQYSIKLRADTYYYFKINFSCNKKPQSFYIDLYSSGYDNFEQENHFTIHDNMSSYRGIIFSGNPPIDNETFLRVVVDSSVKCDVRNLEVDELTSQKQDNVYIPYMDNELGRVYKNRRVRDILFSPKYVKNISSSEDIYKNLYKYDLYDTNYIENYNQEKDLRNANTIISDIKQTRNTIKAKVKTDNDSFVNFSQVYFPGWVAYIDGVRYPVHLVNGIIMGVEIPKGEHNIEFRFTSKYFTIGAIISALTFVLCIILFIRDRCASCRNKRIND